MTARGDRGWFEPLTTSGHGDRPGSVAGYYRHYRAGEAACPACLAAVRAYQQAARDQLRGELGRGRRESRASAGSLRLEQPGR